MILGRFYFRLTNNGNLIGEFSNNAMRGVSTESADRIPDLLVRDFVGDYNSTWHEQGAEVLSLNISRKQNTNEIIFSLLWRNGANQIVFRGEGFIVDNLLIGNYWDEEVQTAIGARLQQP